MKIKRVITLLLIFTMMFCANVFAKPAESNLFLGEILEVKMDSKQENTMLLVKGYLKSCEVFQEEIIAIVSKDTVLLSGCEKQAKELKFEKGDTVFIELNPKMTFSIPPQSPALKIQVTKQVKN